MLITKICLLALFLYVSVDCNSLNSIKLEKSTKFYRAKEQNFRYKNQIGDEIRSGSIATCRNFPGLTKKQGQLCFRYPDVMSAAIQGLQAAVHECKFQFQKHRWNCSSLDTKNKNPHNSLMLQRGYRETAFALAISSAGVAHSVAKACGQGKLKSCGCDSSSRGLLRRPDWRWGGCSHNMDFGVKFSKFFADSKERGADIYSRVHLHNSHAGRLAVSTNMEVRCKCHGMSGSCEMKTCWRAAPDFRRVGTVLKHRFDRAVLINQSQIGNEANVHSERSVFRRLGHQDLVYYERSPNFCEERPDVDYPGITGRRCNRTGSETDSCNSLCCGRGYNTIRQKRTERCNCRFHWCCNVVCNNCTIEEWVTVCK